MNSELYFSFYYLGLLLGTIFLSRFLIKKYVHFANKYNLTESVNKSLAKKTLRPTGAGVVFAAVLMLISLFLQNLDIVEFSNFSPVLATGILIAFVGFYNDFNKISSFSKYLILTFLILMLIYSNAKIPIIENLNGFLGITKIDLIPGLIYTIAIYLIIINTITNLSNDIDGYLAIFSIFFFLSLLYNFNINKFYTLNSVSVIIIGCFLYSFSKQKNVDLGNSASLFIGFWISTYLIVYITSAPTSRLVEVYSINLENIPIIAISMLSIPLLDTFRLVFLRIFNKKSLFELASNHFHHILLDRGMTHFRTSLILTFINWFNCIIIFLMEPNFKSKELTLIFLGISLSWLVFFEYLNRKNISS